MSVNNLLARVSWMITLVIYSLLFTSCGNKEGSADTIYHNARFLTMNDQAMKANYVAVKDGIILSVGQGNNWERFRANETELVDLEGSFAMPGLIEGHGHFHGVGESVIKLNFLQDTSWSDILTKIENRIATAQKGDWILGRGWHQEKLVDIDLKNVGGYPIHHELSEISKDNPIILTHASGHAVLANQKAMNLSGVSVETPDPSGGHIVRDENGEAIGVFEERAMKIVRDIHQEYLASLDEEQLYSEWLNTTRAAEKHCLAHGITSFQDAGSTDKYVKNYQRLAQNNSLDIRLWAMLRQPWEELAELDLSDYPIINEGNKFFTCRAMKSELDGALGSYGAWLLDDYSDKAGFHGQNTTKVKDVKNIAELCLEKNMQLCVHAIGDRANQIVLDLFEAVAKKENSLRWRIEHAQHLAPEDIPRFSELNAIASMQGVHCTSDAPFVVKRLGAERAQGGAYAWRSLLDLNVKIANGTDAPVESINPFENLYASVTRRYGNGEEAFFPEQKMTRLEALRSYTIDNAYAAFEEDDKGSLENGKLADIVVLDTDLLQCEDEELAGAKVLLTIVGGEVKYQAE